jgi:hypothetical protein
MAAIGTIRKYSGIAVGAIFYFNSCFYRIRGISVEFPSFSVETKWVVGVIDGEKISYSGVFITS